MSMTTATERLAKYLTAESEILAYGKSNVFKDCQLTRADLDVVVKKIEELKREVVAENAKAAGAPTIGGLGYSLARLDS
jgi:hypothetical protein